MSVLAITLAVTAHLLAFTLQDNSLAKLVEQLRSDKLEQRKAAVAALIDLRKQNPKHAEAIRKFAELEQDAAVKARLEHVLHGVTLRRSWSKPVPGAAFPGVLAASADYVATTGEENADASRVTMIYMFQAQHGAASKPWPIGTVTLKGRATFADNVLLLPATLVGPKLQMWRISYSNKPAVVWTGTEIDVIDGAQCRVADGRTGIVSIGGATLLGLNAQTGTESWKVEGLDTRYLAAEAGKLLFVDGKKQLTCADGGDPTKVVWKTEAGAAIGALGMAGDRAIALSDPTGGELRAFGLKDGAPLWNCNPPWSLWGAVEWTLTADYVAFATNRAVHGFDAATGKHLWTRDRGTGSRLFVFATIAGCIALGDAQGLVLIDLATGGGALDPDAPITGVQSAAVAGNFLYVMVAGNLVRYEVTR